jgi:hypothetical protein
MEGAPPQTPQTPQIPQSGQGCRPCSLAGEPVSAVTVAVVILLAVVIIYYLARWLGRTQKDRFASQKAQEVYSSSQELFERTRGGATYSDYKVSVPDADAVTFTDVRRLWRAGQLSPENVQAVI